ncbi:MAG TPA: L,D-transpeptidase family protein [Beijerinckiaceae bacterium]|nr:L,D-transpeptidase family protein [Beijerinckiaceae bacterium]
MRALRRLLLPVLVVLSATYAWVRMAPPPQPVVEGPAPARASHVVIHKSERLLTLFAGDRAFRTYRIALGGAPSGAKRQEGDGRTPEGRYHIDAANPRSAYHLSLRISYPDRKDRAAAASRSVAPGGDIMIHGLPNGYGAIGIAHRLVDWTNGCIALTNGEMDEIWRLVPVGTPVEILP